MWVEMDLFVFFCLFFGIKPENPYSASRLGLEVTVNPLGVYYGPIG